MLCEKTIGINSQFKSIFNKALKVSKSNSTILIQGESGTGKEIIAKLIHSNSNRKEKSFITLNCSAIPKSIAESELFGYERGTFTGAEINGKKGKFEIANKGTLFLDEIGDMPYEIQSKFLRVLQNKSIMKIGGKKNIPIDVRVIAATNKDLESMVEEGLFREDLYYRLNVIPLKLPPLRVRKEDILLLIDYYIDIYCIKLNKQQMKVCPELKKWLINYNWPGNIRQLVNFIEYTVNICENNVISFEHIPDYMKQIKILPEENKGLNELIDEYEKKVLIDYVKYKKSSEEKLQIAKELKISRATLYRKLKKYSLI